MWSGGSSARTTTPAHRYMTAYGRDVDVPEARLDYDHSTRRLTVAGGSPADAKVDAALAAVCKVLSSRGALSGRAIKQALADSDHSRNTVEAALQRGVQVHVLRIEEGPRGARFYTTCRSVRHCPASIPGQCE